ncbi:hypothetical protein OOT46_16225 [Aquabacterium sp. A7-Y]|uniref:hypothetical protein n=1 Tax=Aquabacterium sp. A7-Y TaxID=1349605 RepID=UPI00223DBF06|nr:hypothetical protein [Aquabacterium sp. A7-Y]MCW7539392.1 hypothetical protein [Aquabacterium sp. A7-Y]
MNFFKRSDSGLFASRSLFAHLSRGAVAIVLLAWAIDHQTSHPLLSLSAGIAALVAFRGCPVCWTIGLAETWVQRGKVLGITRER